MEMRCPWVSYVGAHDFKSGPLNVSAREQDDNLILFIQVNNVINALLLESVEIKYKCPNCVKCFGGDLIR